MSSKVMSVLAAVIMGVAFLAGTTQGCGGGSSGTSATAICNKLCNKVRECYGDAPGADQVVTQCNTTCVQNVGDSTGPSAKCGNLTPAQASARFDLCYPMACPAFQTCATNVCGGGTTGTAGTGATGAGGTTGTAGTGSSTGAAGFAFDGSIPNFDGSIPGFDASGLLGSGGSAGSTCGTACAKADQCCAALGQQNCGLAAACTAGTGNVQSCNAFLQLANLSGAAPAACK
jgi:hypothetical protein